MRAFSQLYFAALVALTSCRSVVLPRDGSALDVKITSTGNSGIKATLTNLSTRKLRLLREGTLLDDAPVSKLSIESESASPQFRGIHKQVRRQGLSDSAFVAVEAGQSLEIDIDIASVHDLNLGGVYNVLSKGKIPFAKDGSNDLGGNLSYKSNNLTLNIDGHLASLVPMALQKRSNIQDCEGAQYEATKLALAQCNWLATSAGYNALNGDVNKFGSYWGTTDPGYRQKVAARFYAIANECSNSPTGGNTGTHCVDTYGSCTPDTLAYTAPAASYIVNCPLYFSFLPAVANSCHGQDQATTTIHEMTHADIVFGPSTDDLCTGYDECMRLGSDQKLNAADMYMLYANAILINC